MSFRRADLKTEIPLIIDLFEFFFIYDFDFFAVQSDNTFCGKIRKGTDSIGRGHVGQVGQIFPGETNF